MTKDLSGIAYHAALVVVVALPLASIVWTITKEEVFAELRTAVEKWAKRDGRYKLLRDKLAYLVNCYYCTAYWVAALMVAILDLKWLDNGWRGTIAAWLTLPWVAQFWLMGFDLIRSVRNKARRWAEPPAATKLPPINSPDPVRAFMSSIK